MDRSKPFADDAERVGLLLRRYQSLVGGESKIVCTYYFSGEKGIGNLMFGWTETEIVITVRAFPEPSKKYRETSCVAGIDLTSSTPIRIFPVFARETNIHKFQRIRARVKKTTDDTRPESHRIDSDSIHVLETINTANGWRRRTELVKPFRVAPSIEQLQAMRDSLGHKNAPSLALIRPREITAVEVTEKKNQDWTEAQKASLTRAGLFDDGERRDPLEFVPYDLRYSFLCQDETCTGHRFRCVDWEASEAFRKWSKQYDNDWKDKFLQKFHTEMVSRDLQFFVGTINKHPDTWTIIGLYYPPFADTRDGRFENLPLPLGD